MSCDICRPGHYRRELGTLRHCSLCHEAAVRLDPHAARLAAQRPTPAPTEES